ncbi:MAG: hypothetical protein OXC57_13070 [Rhodobacteraceae bacterium]|nr:hypothetical protein [Paracoccaceae bacterium]
MTRAIPIQELLDELDVYRDRNMIARALAIDPQYPFPMLTFLTGSDPGREPPRLDCIFLLADPVYLALTHKGKRSRQLMEVRNLYLDTKNMLVRRMPGAR